MTLEFPLDPKRIYSLSGKELQELLDKYSIRVATDAASRVLESYGDKQIMTKALLKGTSQEN